MTGTLQEIFAIVLSGLSSLQPDKNDMRNAVKSGNKYLAEKLTTQFRAENKGLAERLLSKTEAEGVKFSQAVTSLWEETGREVEDVRNDKQKLSESVSKRFGGHVETTK
jgi:hypothetical protein